MIKYICDCCESEMTRREWEDSFHLSSFLISREGEDGAALCPHCSSNAREIEKKCKEKIRETRDELRKDLMKMIKKGKR